MLDSIWNWWRRQTTAVPAYVPPADVEGLASLLNLLLVFGGLVFFIWLVKTIWNAV